MVRKNYFEEVTFYHKSSTLLLNSKTHSKINEQQSREFKSCFKQGELHAINTTKDQIIWRKCCRQPQ